MVCCSVSTSGGLGRAGSGPGGVIFSWPRRGIYASRLSSKCLPTRSISSYDCRRGWGHHMRCILLFLSFAIFSAGYSAVHAEPTTGFHSELHCYILSGKKFTRVVTARFVDYDWSGRCTHGRHPFRSSDCMRPSYATGTDLSCRLGFLSMSARGLSVFVVEDEPMIRIIVADMLGVLGHTIAAEAGHVDQALELAQSAEFDLAILDVNIDDKQIIPVADLIKTRGCRSFLLPPMARTTCQKHFESFKSRWK
jgi:hypothetical protein